MSNTVRYRGQTYRQHGRYFQSDDTALGARRLLHRAVWIDQYGPIPDGFHVHHRDGNGLNNALKNLALIHGGAHSREHMLERHKDPAFRAQSLAGLAKAREAAKAWHRSPAGRAWHVQHASRAWTNRSPGVVICTVCGASALSEFPGRTKFCSPKCAQKGCYAKQKTDPRVCLACGQPFLANKYRAAKFCGYRCSNRFKLRGAVKRE